MPITRAFKIGNMRKLKLLAAVTLAILAVGGCKSYYDALLKSDDIDVKFKAAMDYYGKNKFRKSAELFESLILPTQGTPREDTVQYYNAMSNYKYGDYITAEQNFAKFLEVFPRSPFTEESKFLRIKCLYEGTYRWELDQLPTQKAMSIITEFMYEHPESQYYNICKAMMAEFQERIDRKSFEAAKLYYSMQDYKAAHYALKGVLKDNANNQYREQVLYFTAMSSYRFAQKSVPERQKERYMTFVDDYYNFAGEYPKAPEKRELDGYFVKARKIAGLKVTDSAMVAQSENPDGQEAEGVIPKTAAGVKADRRSAKQAIRDAKKAVKIEESKNSIAAAVSDDKELKKQKRAEEKAIEKENRADAKAAKQEERLQKKQQKAEQKAAEQKKKEAEKSAGKSETTKK